MKTNCNIIKDLLPLYAEDMLSEDSAALVKEHLGECPDCSYELIGMKDDSRKKRVEKDLKEVIDRKNELKKLNRKMNRRISINILIIIVLSLTTIISSVYAVNSTRLLYEELSPPEIRFDYPDRETTNDTNIAQGAVLNKFNHNSLDRKLFSITYKDDKAAEQSWLKKINKKFETDNQFTDCKVFSISYRSSYNSGIFLIDVIRKPYSVFNEDWIAVKDKDGNWLAYAYVNDSFFMENIIYSE